MSCGVLVVNPASPRSPEAPGDVPVDDQDGAPGLGHELA